MMHWNAAYALAAEAMRDEDCTLLRYEDLVARPEEELLRVAGFLDLAPRADAGRVEGRHQELRDSNADYVRMHEGTRYGPGIWDRFGYTA
jgi:hypothetical protein